MTGGQPGAAGRREGQRRARPRKPGAGRRRDPTIDDRVRQAARTLYAREGWAGFHFDGVARAAGVSKDAVYRRYPDAEALLLDALSAQSLPLLADDRPVEDALVAFGCDVFAYFASGNGYANLRVHIDGGSYPNVLQQYRDRVVEPQITQAVTVLEKAKTAGALHPDASPSAVVEALGGAVIVLALAGDSRLDDDGRPEADVVRQLTEVVQQILHGRLTDAPSAATRRHR
ncbi:TetR/AcrR family transcriptional regulator [Mycolicibacterium sp. XJ662]